MIDIIQYITLPCISSDTIHFFQINHPCFPHLLSITRSPPPTSFCTTTLPPTTILHSTSLSLCISCPQPSQTHSDLLINFFLPTEVPALSLLIAPLYTLPFPHSTLRTSPSSTDDIYCATFTNLLLGPFINIILKDLFGLFHNGEPRLQSLQRLPFYHPCYTSEQVSLKKFLVEPLLISNYEAVKLYLRSLI